MKLFKKFGVFTIILASLLVTSVAFAATSPGLGAANTFVVLSGTYANSVSGTTLNGDLGYTTPPATAATVNGATHIADSVYNQAGIDQNNALSALNNQPCSFTFAPGPINLASDTTHGAVGVYGPGVYCISGAAAIGGGGTITLTGTGTYIFRMDGALTTSAGSNVVLAGGASSCDIWWTPTQATTLGANTIFAGTDIDAAGITIGNTTTWNGQALAFGGTVTTTTDTISAPTCTAARALTPPAPIVPGLPNTATATVWNVLAIAVIAGIMTIVSLLYIFRKKA